MEDLHNFHVLITCFFLVLSWLCLKAYGYIWARPKRLEKKLKQQGIKGTPYRALFGDAKEYMNLVIEAWSKPITTLSHDIVQRVDPFTHNMVKKYGKISFCWMGTTPRLTIMDAGLIKKVLMNKNGHFQKPPMNPLILTLTKGLSTLQGETWVAHRKIINPAFHFEKLKAMVPVFVSSSIELIDKWERSMLRGGGTLEIDIGPEFQELTADIISRTAFGSNYEEGKEILRLQKDLQKLVIQAMQTLYIPGFRFIPTRNSRRMHELNRKITSMLRTLVEKKESTMQNGEDNLLSLLFQSNNENSSSSKHMTTDEIIEECKQFYLAGHETTSSWLTWTVTVLAMHQDWQQKARDEVLEFCRDEDPNANTINQLKIVNMILHEVLRLYPPVIALYQHSYKESKIGNLEIQPGVDLVLPIMFLNRDTDLWGDDAMEFKPERFSQGISKACKDQAAFLSFGWGPRTCVGQNFAVIEAKVAMAMILKRFWFEVSPSYVHAPYTEMMLQPQHGAQIIFHPL